MDQRPFRSYAQNLEDIVLWRALHRVQKGCYVDIGANEPRSNSVSRGFYEQGWRGVHVEPSAECAARLREDRPDEVVHEVALSDRCGELDFFLAPINGLSTGIPAHMTPGSRPCRVAMRTLASFGPGWPAPEVHWMKIDVEGMEASVLRGWDPTLLRPWILLIEATRPNSTEPNHAEWEPLVLAAGYRFALFDGLNRFYVASERAELMDAVSSPANIFDLMAGCRIEAWIPYAGAPRVPPGRRLRHAMCRMLGLDAGGSNR
jgi:FkbM family methyltransferase